MCPPMSLLVTSLFFQQTRAAIDGRVGQHVMGRTLNSSGTCGPTVRLSEQGLFVVCNYGDAEVCRGAVGTTIGDI